MEQWYTLHTKPNAEYQVAATLEQRNLKVYLPELEVPKARAKRKKKPLFPSYLFVNVDLESLGLSNLRWIPGLRRIVAVDDHPVPVPGKVIELIRYRLGETVSAGGDLAHSFQPGDSVRFIDGPFRDLPAIFEGPTTPAKRVQVLLRILGASRVQANVTDLEKAPSDSETPEPRRSRRTRGRGRRINY